MLKISNPTSYRERLEMLTWQISHLGGSGAVSKLTRTCFLVAVEWVRASQSAQSAASSTQHITEARFFSHKPHCILILTN